jgi:predicted dehydrogenase
MTHRSRLSALLLPFALLASIPVATAGAQNRAEKQLHALLAAYETSLNAGDGARIEQLYTEDGCPTFDDAVTRHRMLDAIETAAATGQRQRLG